VSKKLRNAERDKWAAGKEPRKIPRLGRKFTMTVFGSLPNEVGTCREISNPWRRRFTATSDAKEKHQGIDRR
jgi:hypothetical protein